MTDLTTLTADERRRILDDYLDAVFTGAHSEVAERMRIGAPELPDDPSADQVAAWVELAELLRDPDFIASSRRMAQRALADGPQPDASQFEVGKAVGEHGGAALRAGVDPSSAEALAVIERLEQLTPGEPEDRALVAERIETGGALLGAGRDRQRLATARAARSGWAVRCLGVVRACAARARDRRLSQGRPRARSTSWATASSCRPARPIAWTGERSCGPKP